MRSLTASISHKAPTAVAESQRVAEVKQTGRNVSNQPGLILKIDRLDIERSRLGFTDQARTHPSNCS
jgi:hypothetical protein